MEFTGIELAGGEELATSVEKATTDLMRVVTVPVKKVVRALEKATADGRRRWRKVGSRCGLQAR
jgi:hypothetical protein